MRLVDVGSLLESLGIEGKREHDEWRARCPNRAHIDRKPSWQIVDDVASDRHGLHNCFPCGFGGDAVSLTMAVLDVGYLAATCWVDEHLLQVDLKTTVRVEVADPYRTFVFPAGTEPGAPLERWPVPFRRYVEGRGITPWQAAHWGLTYALEGRLAGRVVVPTRNGRGRLLSYTARAVGRAERRYLTPKREEGADLAAVFGEEHWPTGARSVVVCEGAFDALAVERAVPELAVAALGTGGVANASTPGVLAKLRRFDGRVVVVTDADDAGDEAFAMLECNLDGATVLRARPPEGMDAAELDPQELRGIIREAWQAR